MPPWIPLTRAGDSSGQKTEMGFWEGCQEEADTTLPGELTCLRLTPSYLADGTMALAVSPETTETPHPVGDPVLASAL